MSHYVSFFLCVGAASTRATDFSSALARWQAILHVFCPFLLRAFGPLIACVCVCVCVCAFLLPVATTEGKQERGGGRGPRDFCGVFHPRLLEKRRKKEKKRRKKKKKQTHTHTHTQKAPCVVFAFSLGVLVFLCVLTVRLSHLPCALPRRTQLYSISISTHNTKGGRAHRPERSPFSAGEKKHRRKSTHRAHTHAHPERRPLALSFCWLLRPRRPALEAGDLHAADGEAAHEHTARRAAEGHEEPLEEPHRSGRPAVADEQKAEGAVVDAALEGGRGRSTMRPRRAPGRAGRRGSRPS